MHKTIEVIIEADGTVRFLEPFSTGGPKRALLTILDDLESTTTNESALLSERALADWEREEEDEAWGHLQPDR